MNITSFRKETSERSEVQNWVLDELSASGNYYFSGFEGCNENSSNQVTAILDRVSIVIEGQPDILPQLYQVTSIIESLEGKALPGKISFCSRLGLPYSYVLYNYDHGFVLRYELDSNGIYFRERYDSFAQFSEWIQSIKDWVSNKGYINPGLPEFDKALRRAGCPWPTNIDSVAFTNTDHPVALIEFQNAKRTTVEAHTNNTFFLPIWDSRNNTYISGPDEQRWRSQEILRLQSGLPHFTIVWSQDENNVIIKQLTQVTFPDFSDADKSKLYLKNLGQFNAAALSLSRIKESPLYQSIRFEYPSYNFILNNGQITTQNNLPPLSIDAKTFPYIYGQRLFHVNTREEVLGIVERCLISFST